MTMTLKSPAFSPSGPIPAKYTCDGEETSPPLEWSGVPDRALSLALIVDDPDAPDPAAPKRRFVHWVLYNIPPDARGLSEGAARGKLPPEWYLTSVQAGFEPWTGGQGLTTTQFGVTGIGAETNATTSATGPGAVAVR